MSAKKKAKGATEDVAFEAAARALQHSSFFEHANDIVEERFADGTRCFSARGQSDGVVWFDPDGTVSLGWQHNLRSPDKKFATLDLLKDALIRIRHEPNAFRIGNGRPSDAPAWKVAERYIPEVLMLLEALADDKPSYFEDLAEAMRHGVRDNDFALKYEEVRRALEVACERCGRIPTCAEVAFEYARLRQGKSGPSKSDSDSGKMHGKLSALGFVWIPMKSEW